MRVNCVVAACAAAVGLSSIPTALAWGAAGHEMVATIAQMHLHPSVLPQLCTILNFTSTDPDLPPCHLAPIAIWADKIRYLPHFRWTAPLHYIGAKDDYPSATCAFPGDAGWQGRKGHNVLAATRNVTTVLQEYNKGGYDDATANEALKFLIHFLGDLHMPLHLTGRDRGGNSDKVLFDGRVTNLHSVWDSKLIAQSLLTLPRNYTRPLPVPQIEYHLRDAIYDPFIRRVMWEGILGKWANELPEWLSCPAKTPASWFTTAKQAVLRFAGVPLEDTDDDTLCPYHWATPIHDLNCDIVWPKALDEPPYVVPAPHAGALVRGPWLELNTPEYAGVIHDRWIIERVIAQGGIRLAGVLNWLFADDGPEDAPFLWTPVVGA